MNFTFCKNRCNYTKRNKRSRNPPSLRPTLPKPHYPSPRTKLASPRKRVRFCCSVKPSQLWWGLNLIELLSLKLQSIRSAIIRPAPTIPKSHFPSKSTISLPPLSKVRCCRPKKFGRLPEGLPHHSSQNRTIPRLALNLPPLEKG